MAAVSYPSGADVPGQSRMSVYGGMALGMPRNSSIAPPSDQNTLNQTSQPPYLNQSSLNNKAMPMMATNESRYLSGPPPTDPNLQAASNGMFYDERDNGINRQANKMFSNFNHIVFNGAATTIDDAELEKIRRYQQAVTYQKSLLEQIEANKMRKELEKENERREMEIERLKLERQAQQERQDKERMKEQERLILAQKRELLEKEQQNQAVLLKSQSQFRRTSRAEEGRLNKSLVKTVTIETGSGGQENRKSDPNMSQSLFLQRRELHKRETRQREDSRGRQKAESDVTGDWRGFEERKMARMLSEVKGQIQNEVATKVGEIARKIEENAEEVKRDIGEFKEATQALEKERRGLMDNLHRFRKEVGRLRTEEQTRHRQEVQALRNRNPYRIVPTYGFNYEESESEMEAYREALKCIFDPEGQDEEYTHMKLREVFQEDSGIDSGVSADSEEDVSPHRSGDYGWSGDQTYNDSLYDKWWR